MIDYEYRSGGLTHDPELRFTGNGTPVLPLRLAQSASKYNEETREWETKAAHYFTVVVWPQKKGEHTIDLPTYLAQVLTRGSQVIVKGQFKTRSYETKDGEERTVTEFVASQVALDAAEAAAQQGDQDPAPQNQAQSSPQGPRDGFGGYAEGEPPF